MDMRGVNVFVGPPTGGAPRRFDPPDFYFFLPRIFLTLFSGLSR